MIWAKSEHLWLNLNHEFAPVRRAFRLYRFVLCVWPEKNQS